MNGVEPGKLRGERAAAPSSSPTTARSIAPVGVRVDGVTVAAPIPQWSIPLAVPITVPRFIQRRLQKGQAIEAKELVRDVHLDIEPGQMLAIIGGSGSGKTTLLNAIAGRSGGLDMSTGSIGFLSAKPNDNSRATTIVGGDRSPTEAFEAAQTLPRREAKKVIGYVRQDDFLMPFLTVRETLNFAAALRLPKSVSAAARTAIVEHTITELGLADAADVVVGGPFRKGISGGEKRRLTIGCTLVQMPSVLVLDEPTTGLDSFTAFQILETLKKLARRGRTVIVTLHGPRSDAFPLFDQLLLLSRGNVVYRGPAAQILPHFASQGFDVPLDCNPLDFVIDVSSVDSRTPDAELATQERVGRLVAAWREREVARTQQDPKARGLNNARESRLDPHASGFDASAPPRDEVDDGAVDSNRANLVRQTSLLTRRGLRNVFRNYPQMAGLLLQAIIIGVVMGLVFLNPPETPAGIQSLKTVVFFVGPGAFYLSIILAVYILCEDLVVFDREQEDGLYETVPWVTSTILSYLPINVISPTIFAILVYFMTGWRRDNLAKNLFSLIANCIMQQQAAWAFALFCSAINRSFAQASLLANGLSIPFLLSSGYLITHILGWISWTRWLSPYFYGFHWMVRLQFDNRTFACDGIQGAARNQCIGENVLRGMRIRLSTPVFVYPLGLLGFILVMYALGILILSTYHPGGVKHATQVARKPEDEKEKDVSHDEASMLERKPSRRPVDVSVKNLQLTVARKSLFQRGQAAQKVILENVSAEFPSGQVSVIMGPSGAGKSSLLQMLAGRLGSGATSAFSSTGSITLNGQLFDSSLGSLVAFVEQEDTHHLPALTVRETLHYAARLRLSDRSPRQCAERAEEVLLLLGLSTCADTLVGGPLVKGISGGEKRRLSLAVELLSDPTVLYADEPTSGLDAFTAQNVMQTLRDLASDGRTIVVSIHQPRSDIWQMFDSALLLVKGGRTAYSGPAHEILPYFSRVGRECPPHFNPADFVIDVVSVDYHSPEDEKLSKARINDLVESWRHERDAIGGGKEKVAAEAAPDTRSSSHDKRSAKLRKTPFRRAFPTVLARSFRNLRRQPDVFIARVSNPPFMALFFFVYFARLGFGPSSSQDRIGLLQETTALPFVGMLACIAIFPSEKNLYEHEWKSSARYGVTTFLSVYTLQETVTSILSAFLFSVIFVFGMNLQWGGTRFLQFWYASFALISAGESVGIIFSAFTRNGGLTTALVSAALTLLAQLNGIISVTLPYFLVVIGWVSPMRPQAALMMINEMTGLQFECTQAEVASGACIYTNGAEVLRTFGLPYGETGKYCGILAALVVLWRLAAFGGMRLRVAFL